MGDGVYAVTAANVHESSWGTYCMPEDKVNGKHLNTCLGDLFSVNWMEDIDMEADMSAETLEKQFQLVKNKTSRETDCPQCGSHVQRFSDLSFTSEAVGDFVGNATGALFGDSAPVADDTTKGSVSVR